MISFPFGKRPSPFSWDISSFQGNELLFVLKSKDKAFLRGRKVSILLLTSYCIFLLPSRPRCSEFREAPLPPFFPGELYVFPRRTFLFFC